MTYANMKVQSTPFTLPSGECVTIPMLVTTRYISTGTELFVTPAIIRSGQKIAAYSGNLVVRNGVFNDVERPYSFNVQSA